MNKLFLKNKKALMVAAIVLVCVLLAGFRWFMTYSSATASKRSMLEKKQSHSASVPAVRAFKIQKSAFIDNLIMTGNLQGGARVELKFKREGQISKIHHRVGDRVRKGQIIAEMDLGEAQIKLQQAEAELSQAVDLYRSGAIAKPRLTQARLAAQLARKVYDHSFISAPRNGSIGELNSEVGEYVTPQNTVATLVSVEKVFVEMGVIEKDLGKLHLNQMVQVEVETYPGVIFEGSIQRIAPLVEGQSRTRTVRAELDNEKGLLLPGMFAQAKIFILEKPDVMVIPATALRTEKTNAGKNKFSLFQIDRDNRLKTVPVQVGYESSDYSEIISGVEVGSKVVAQISDVLRNGIQVEVIEEVSYEPH